MLADEVARLRAAIEALSEHIAGLDSWEGIRHATISNAQQSLGDDAAKQEIKAYFEKRHGETVYPSDVADELNLDYDSAVRLIGELEQDGSVARI
jgi:DNA-binding MarR family transcriptional regulator